MCDKAINKCFLAFIYITDRHKTQEMCDRAVSEDHFMLVYCPYKYKTQRVCDEAVDDCLAALTFSPDWFVTRKMLEKHDHALHANDDILFYNEDFNKVTFIASQRHILAADLDNNNFYEDDPNTIIHVRLWLDTVVTLKKCRALKRKDK